MGRDNKSMNPNSFDQEIKDAQANPNTQGQGTEPVTPEDKPAQEGEPSVDYQKKFAESSKEALRLYEENKKLQEELAAKANEPVMAPPMESVYPGFEQLDPEAQKNLIAYTNVVTKRATEEIYKNPAIAHSVKVYNENKFDNALGSIVAKFPELEKSKSDFKSKYFNANNIPDNIENILSDLAKAYLYDKAVEIGAEKERAKAGRVELERGTGGDKTPQVNRSLEDWMRMSQENPMKFAQLSKEYQADMDSGKLKE
jgi:hypothetical protein